MKFEELKTIVGIVGNVTITSEMRYSELSALVRKVAIHEGGRLTIIVKSGTLNYSEIAALAKDGGKYVAFDLTQD